MHLLFESAADGFDGGLTFRDLPHFDNALQAHLDQNYILKNHPTRMFHPAPRAGRQNPEYRLRQIDSAQGVIRRDYDGRGNQYPPVAIERKKRERSKDMEVSLDASPTPMD